MLQRRDLLNILALVALALLVALPVLTYPMGRDQGMYANIARSILNGGLPYIDMWDIKPPAIYYVYALGIAAFGPGAGALRLLDLVTVPVTLAGLYWLALWLTDGDRRAALLAGVLFPVFYFTETFASLTQSDAIVTLPMTLAVVCVVQAGRQPLGARRALAWAGLAGALCALTIWFKHYYALFVLALVAGHIWARGRVPMREALAFSLGGLPVGALPLAYFVVTGVWAEMLIVAQGTAQYNAQAFSGFDAFVAQMWNYVVFRWWHWGLLLVLALGWLVIPGARAHRRRWRLVGLWLAAGLGFVLVQAKGFDTHWLPMLPPLVLLAAAASAGALSLLPVTALRRAALLVAVVGLCVIVVKDTWLRAWPYLTGAEGQMAYYARFQANDLKPNESLRVVRYLQRRTTPGDTLYVWGFRPEVHYLTGLRPATRFQAQFPLASDYYPERWRQENVDVLWAALPPYVLVLQADYMRWVTGRDDDSAWMLAHDYPALNDWLICNYERTTEMGDFIIWRRAARSCLQS